MAYIDPGSGSIILQAILGFIAAAITDYHFTGIRLRYLLVKSLKKIKTKNQISEFNKD